MRSSKNSSKSVSARGSSEERSQKRPRFKKLLRKDSSEEEEFVVPEDVAKDSDESNSEVDVAEPSRFIIGDIDEIKREEEAKKLHNKRIDEMIKKEKQQPKKEKKPNEKFSEDKKAELKNKADSIKKKAPRKKSDDYVDDGKSLDSDEERQIRINRLKAQEDKDLARAIAASKEEDDLRKAL